MPQFLTQNAGKWLSQRTHTVLGQTTPTPRSDKITLFQDVLPPDDRRILDLCERSAQDPQQVIGGLLTRWEKSSDRRPGSSLYIALTPKTVTPADATPEAFIPDGSTAIGTVQISTANPTHRANPTQASQGSNTASPVHSGRFLWSQRQGNIAQTHTGHYRATHHSVVWWAETAAWHLEERIWFPGQNLRLRSTLYSTPEGQTSQSHFYSDIRLGTS